MLTECSFKIRKNEPVHEIANNVVCATSKASDHPAHTRSLVRAFASRLRTMIVKLLTEQHLEFLSLNGGCRLARVYTCQNATLLEITCRSSNIRYHQTPLKLELGSS